MGSVFAGRGRGIGIHTWVVTHAFLVGVWPLSIIVLNHRQIGKANWWVGLIWGRAGSQEKDVCLEIHRELEANPRTGAGGKCHQGSRNRCVMNAGCRAKHACGPAKTGKKPVLPCASKCIKQVVSESVYSSCTLENWRLAQQEHKVSTQECWSCGLTTLGVQKTSRVSEGAGIVEDSACLEQVGGEQSGIWEEMVNSGVF